MGITAEFVAERFNVSREDQDKLAFRSHQNAAAAIKEGRFKDEIVPIKVIDRFPVLTTRSSKRRLFSTPTKGSATTLLWKCWRSCAPYLKEAAASPPATLHRPATSSRRSGHVGRQSRGSGLKPMAVFRGYAVAGCPPEIMGVGPSVAIPQVDEVNRDEY